jgi:hypothetical protein
MSKKNKIIWSILILIFILIVWVVYSNWNSILAFTDALKYSQEELDKRLEDTKNDVQEYIDKNDEIVVRDLTEEESKALNNGEITEDEAISIITGQSETEEKSDSKNNTGVTDNKPATGTNDVKTNNDISTVNQQIQGEKTAGQKVSELIAKLYVQKSIYLNKLDDVEAEVRAIFIGIRTEERAAGGKFGYDRQQEEKKRLLNEYLPKVAAWETSCDDMVYGIFDEIKAVLKESNGDLTIVDKLEESYLNEKKTKKSYFINRYMD